ncbi:hypothetical protein DMENIID0001_079490 [Sergentomyia squamirostris]
MVKNIYTRGTIKSISWQHLHLFRKCVVYCLLWGVPVESQICDHDVLMEGLDDSVEFLISQMWGICRLKVYWKPSNRQGARNISEVVDGGTHFSFLSTPSLYEEILSGIEASQILTCDLFQIYDSPEAMNENPGMGRFTMEP